MASTMDCVRIGLRPHAEPTGGHRPAGNAHVRPQLPGRTTDTPHVVIRRSTVFHVKRSETELPPAGDTRTAPEKRRNRDPVQDGHARTAHTRRRARRDRVDPPSGTPQPRTRYGGSSRRVDRSGDAVREARTAPRPGSTGPLLTR